MHLVAVGSKAVAVAWFVLRHGWTLTHVCAIYRDTIAQHALRLYACGQGRCEVAHPLCAAPQCNVSWRARDDVADLDMLQACGTGSYQRCRVGSACLGPVNSMITCVIMEMSGVGGFVHACVRRVTQARYRFGGSIVRKP